VQAPSLLAIFDLLENGDQGEKKSELVIILTLDPPKYRRL
jgi:hypothetical protein